MKVFLAALAAVTALLGSTDAAADVEYLTSPGSETLNLPFSEAVRVGDMLYLSGQIGNLPGTLTLAPGGLEAEARQAMDNIKAILERHGASMAQVVKCTVMIADIADWPKFNEIYVRYFPGPKPARSAFAAKDLALGGRVEVECWASLK
ncbi:MAG: RidA family protein [Pseudomonadales bacterium]